MKCLNLGRRSLDYVDDIIWQNNPFYCHPHYWTFKSNLTFKNLCEDALGFLADVCLQGYLCGSKSFENELDHLDEHFFSVNFDISSESGSEMNNESGGATAKLYFMSKLEEFLFERGFKISPVCLAESEATCGCKCLYKVDYLIWRTDGQLFKVFRDNASDKVSVLNDILRGVVSLQLEIEDKYNLNKLQTYTDNFNREFLAVFEVFDAIKNDSAVDSDTPFEITLKLCEKIETNIVQNQKFGLLLPLNKTSDELTKQLNLMNTHAVDISENTEKYSSSTNNYSRANLFGRVHFAKSVVSNLHEDSNRKEEDRYERSSTASGEYDIPEWSEEPRDGLEVTMSELDAVVSAMWDESEELSLRVKGEMAQAARRRDVPLPVVWEVEEDEGVWSDVEAWRSDLWRSVLEDTEEDWFQATSVSLPAIINQVNMLH